MAKDNDTEMDGLEIDDSKPIIPSNKIKQNVSTSSPGYKFYAKIRDYLPEYWDDFSTTIYKGKPKYRTVRTFAQKKFKSKTEQRLFILMTASVDEWEAHSHTEQGKSDKHTCPWLGDWEAKRRNGYWTSNTVHARYLKNALKETVESSKAIKATAPFILQMLMRWSKMEEKIDLAFGGEPFLEDNPSSSKNSQRFRAYKDALQAVTDQKLKLIREWMRIHGVNPDSPNEMFNMGVLAQLTGQVGAAAALTGFAAGQQGFALQNPQGAPTIISRDSLLLADHLTQHRAQYIDAVIDDDVVHQQTHDKDKEKVNGKSKHN
jgi:hypothetical protein